MFGGFEPSTTKTAQAETSEGRSWKPVLPHFRCDSSVLEAQIHRDAIVMFSKTTCGYCVKAKRLLESHKQRYTSIELNKIVDPENCLQKTLVDTTHSKTLPQIFVCQQFVGGFTELNKLVEENKLDSMLEKCPRKSGRL